MSGCICLASGYNNVFPSAYVFVGSYCLLLNVNLSYFSIEKSING